MASVQITNLKSKREILKRRRDELESDRDAWILQFLFRNPDLETVSHLLQTNLNKNVRMKIMRTEYEHNSEFRYDNLEEQCVELEDQCARANH